jgi:hypothetical protein
MWPLVGSPSVLRQAAWYTTPSPTFSDTLAFVRRRLWPAPIPSPSTAHDDLILIPRARFDRLTDAFAFAA